MLGRIKNKSKGWIASLIVFVVAAPLAFSGIQSSIGSNNNPVIATVDGEEINAIIYFNLLAKKQKQIQDQIGDAYSLEIDSVLRQALIDELINEKLLDNYTNAESLVTLSQEVYNIIQSNKIFQVEGVFSEGRYEQLLSLNGFTPAGYENEQLRALLRDQIRRNLANSGFLASAQIEQLNALAKQEREILYIALNTDDFDDQVVIDDSQVVNYYDDNQSNFIKPARVKVDYIELSLNSLAPVADADDATLQVLYNEEQGRFTSAEARQAQHILLKTEEEAITLLERISDGADFDKMAESHSTDLTTNVNGGDLGYFERNHMVPEFDSVVFEMAVGEISEVVKSDYGYHIIKLNDIVDAKLKSFADVESQLQALYKEKITTKELYNLQAELASLSYEEPLDIVADEFGLTLETSEFFSAVSDIYDPQFVKAAYSDLVRNGENSDVLEMGTKFVVLSLVDEQPARPKTLDQVYVEIQQILKTLEAKTIMNELADKLVSAFSNGDTVLANAIMSENKLSWIDAGWIKRSTSLPFNISAQAYKVSKPKGGLSSYAVINFDNSTTTILQLKALKQSEDSDISNITTLYASEASNEWFANFIKSLRQSADIRIFSDLL